MNQQFSRTQLLYGVDAMQYMASCRVAVFGIGGVGGYVVDAIDTMTAKLQLVQQAKEVGARIISSMGAGPLPAKRSVSTQTASCLECTARSCGVQGGMPKSLGSSGRDSACPLVIFVIMAGPMGVISS